MKKETELSVLKEIRDILKSPKVLKSSNRFEKLSDGWVKDNLLGIDWAPQALEKKLNWKDAEEYAKKFGRQPTDIELASLIDRSKYNPAIVDGAEILELKTDDWYWSNVISAWNSDYAWCVYFYSGGVSNGIKGGYDFVRPVRSSQ